MPKGYPKLEAEAHLRQSGPVDLDDRSASDLEVIPSLRTPEAELELFMNDVLTVRVATSNDKNAPPCAEVSVNGRRIFIPRGVETKIAPDDRGNPRPITRMYVERLARAKQTSYSQNLDPRLGEGINRLQKSSGLDYPFEVTHDPSPVGGEWLKRILAEA